MLGRKLRICRKGEKNCYRFSNALAKYMAKKTIDKAFDHYLVTRKEPLLSWGLKPVLDTRKPQFADWSKKSQHWRESRSLKEESGHNKCQCPPAQEVAEVGRGEEYEVQEDATKLPSVNLATTQKTLTQNAKAKLNKIFKYTVKAGKLGYKELAKQAKKHIKNNEKAILEMAKTYGKIYAKKWFEKQKTGSSGFRKMLYEAALKLISSGGSDAPKDITSDAIAKLSEIIKRAEKEGNIGYEQAKKAGRQKRHAEKHINKHKHSISDLVKKYGEMFAKKWLQKQKTSSSGFRELLLDAALQLITQLITHGTSLGSDIPKEIISNIIDVSMDLINKEDV